MTRETRKNSRPKKALAEPTSESRYRRLFETARDGIIILDADTKKITDVNPLMEELSGRSREEFLGKELREIGLLKDTKASQRAFRELREKGHVRYADLKLETKEGARWVEFVSNLDSENGRQIVHCNIRDITKRKVAEEALREAHHRLSFHVENTPLAVIEWDNNFRLARWSPSAERIFGWKSEEVLGKRISDWRFVYSDDVQAVKQVMSRQRKGSEQHGVSRNRNYTKDGSIIDCEWYNSVLYDDAGKLRSVLSLVLDVTARRQAEDERAWLLAREQLARREAEEANRTKDEFLATLSHELRTPLTSILGWSRLLRDGTVDVEKHDQVFETIARNAKSLAQLIDDLLDVSRIITGKLRLDARPVDLSRIITAAVESIRPAARAKEIDLELLLNADVSRVSGDPDRLQQVIWNLLSNAIKFTPRAGKVQVRLAKADSYAEITVMDNGQGIKAEFLPLMFDRFRQFDGSSTRPHRGLGLGLAIVRHLVELHGGMVEGQSEGEGQGARFSVKLPLVNTSYGAKKPASHAAERREAGAVTSATVTSPRIDDLRVLVVDDEADARTLVKIILERRGAAVKVAPSVKKAMEIVEKWKPDVLVADIGMPEEDGYALIRQVRSLPDDLAGQIPAVALTAYARTEDRVHILSAGYQMHLIKPVEPIELLAAVASLAGRTSRT